MTIGPKWRIITCIANKRSIFKDDNDMLNGTVKWFNPKKGYGFISPEVGEKDIFIHITQLEKVGLRQLSDGQKVSFDTYEDRGRTAAGNIEIIE